ncbi:MAG: RNA polymerase sigma-70 factor [Myxococcota bacterium]
MGISAERFEAERPRLFGLAYRMLGRASEAEDAVQDAWVRAQAQADRGPIESPGGFLTTVVTRLCLDRLGSSRSKREAYVGSWLPEPMHTADATPPADAVLARAESVSMAFLRILERLSPVERAVFLLKEAFDYEHDEIAGVLGVSTANSRQLLRRARRHVALDEARFERDPGAQERVLHAFLDAAASGDPARLVELLHPDVEWASDGGGVRPVAVRPIVGRERVAAFAAGIWRKSPPDVTLEPCRVNESAAVLVLHDGAIDTVIGIDVRGERIERFWAIRNPEKLRFLAEQRGLGVCEPPG